MTTSTEPMSAARLLSGLVGALASGQIRVIDLTQTLTPGFPHIALPPEMGQCWPFRIEEVSRYDERGPGWYWNNFSCGEHTGTHFDPPIHPNSRPPLPHHSTHTLPHPPPPRGVQDLRGGGPARARPGPRGCALSGRAARRAGLRLRSHRHRCRAGPAPAPAVPVPLLHAWRGALWPAVPEQPRSAAASGGGADLPAAEDRKRQRQPAARARAGRSVGMSAARPPEGAHTVAEGEGTPSFAARPPEGAHTAAEGEGAPSFAARPPEGEGTPVRAAPGVALVPGASAGIGQQICADLLAQGYEVLALARREAGIDHPRLHSIEVDLSDASATAQAVRECVERFAPTTIVHNAGAIRAAPLSDVKLDDLDALIDLHLGCAITLVQGALPAMRAQRFGRVVLMSSRAVLGLATRTSYSATKAGMLGLARTWALELAADGITVNVVAPG